MYLLDTNACIDFLDGRDEAVAARIAKEFGRLAVSTISIAELMVGSKTSVDPDGDRRKIETFVANIDVLPFDADAAALYGDVIRQVGVKRKSFDRLIGVQAQLRGAVLVTSNGKDFKDIPGLTFENWAQ